MSVAIITGSAGLVGPRPSRTLPHEGWTWSGSTMACARILRRGSFHALGARPSVVTFAAIAITTPTSATPRIESIFARYGRDISLIIHTAAQPSHDWAASDPTMDFTVNANGTSVMLEATRQFAPEPFSFLCPPIRSMATGPTICRWSNRDAMGAVQVTPMPRRYSGNDVHRPHTAQPVWRLESGGRRLVQEYGRYFGMKTACFRGGCLTGPNHSGTQLTDFLPT